MLGALEFLGHWTLILVLFVVLFGVLAFAFAQDRLGSMLLGFVRTVGSLFSSPFVYLRKIVLSLADFGERGGCRPPDQRTVPAQ